jgi:hypothetical protein
MKKFLRYGRTQGCRYRSEIRQRPLTVAEFSELDAHNFGAFHQIRRMRAPRIHFSEKFSETNAAEHD